MKIIKDTKILLTDLDDTVLHWNSQFLPFMETLGLAYRKKGQYHYNDDELDQWEIEQLITDFQHSNFFQNLTPFTCAKAVLPSFKEGGWKIIAISAAKNSKESLENRHINLTSHLPDLFDEVHHTDTHEGKRKYLQKYENAVWVEDNFKNAVMGAKMGHRTYLMDQSYNRFSHNDSVIRIDNWIDIWSEVR